MCECVDGDCSEMIEIDCDVYGAIRDRGDCFIIVKGHVARMGRPVVEQHAAFAVVAGGHPPTSSTSFLAQPAQSPTGRG